MIKIGTFYHVLQKNKALDMPTKIIIYDCETCEKPVSNTRTEHFLKLGVAVYLERKKGGKNYTEEYFNFTNVKQFWKWVLSKTTIKSKLYLIAHNQHFDFMVVNGFNWLTLYGWELKRNILSSNLFIVSFKHEGKTIEVLDSLNWFKTSIKILGSVLGIPKLEIDFKTCSNAELERYCKRDVDILKMVLLSWINFLRKYNLGNFKQTVAAQAFTAFRHRFMRDKIYIHAHKQALKLEREAYRGGRCECFKLGELKEPIYELDFNSLYPSVMHDNSFPTKLVKYVQKGNYRMLQNFLTHFAVIARVTIKIKKPFIGVKHERLIFPVGIFECVLTTPELKAVLKHGEVLEVKEMAIYEQKPIFKTYVRELYDMRKGFKSDNNLIFDMLTKLLLNSLYGKFGQYNETIKELGSCDPSVSYYERGINMDTGERFIQWAFGGKAFIKKGKKTEWLHSFPAISAHVSAFARLRLWEAMKQAWEVNVFYVDTDSLFVNQEGYDALKSLLSETKLGALRLIKKGESLTILGLKDYVFEGEQKIKGVKKNAVKIAANKWEQQRFLKFRSLLREDSLKAPLVDTIIKQLKREYKKGVVLENGKVIPYNFPEDIYLTLRIKKLRKGRLLPSKAEIKQKAVEMFMVDNLGISANMPELNELKEGRYIKEAQLRLMRNPIELEYEG